MRGRRRTRALVHSPRFRIDPLRHPVQPMMFRSVRLERELDRAVDQWLRWLSRWDPITSRRRLSPCEVCPRWSSDLGLDDLPHGVLHALVTPVAAIVNDCFERSVSVRFPELAGRNALEQSADGDGRMLSAVAPEAQQAVEIDLAILFGRIHREAVRCITARTPAIASVIDAHVEPKVQSLAEQLLMEIGA